MDTIEKNKDKQGMDRTDRRGTREEGEDRKEIGARWRG